MRESELSLPPGDSTPGGLEICSFVDGGAIAADYTMIKKRITSTSAATAMVVRFKSFNGIGFPDIEKVVRSRMCRAFHF